MARQPGDLTDEQPVATEERVRVRKRWGWKRWTLAGFLSLIGLIIVTLFALDTPPGRRFIIDQIEAMEETITGYDMRCKKMPKRLREGDSYPAYPELRQQLTELHARAGSTYQP